MAAGPSIYLGKTGKTGRVTGPHSHKELIDLRTGKRIPLSAARADIGQNIEFRLPGSSSWQRLYSQTKPGQFALNPAAPLTSPKGQRLHPVTGQQAYHYGEDYSLPEGTDLRFLGSGSVEGIANYGNAGNVARLRTGDNRYQLDVFHMSKLPSTASVGSTNIPAPRALPGEDEANAQRNQILLEALFGKQSEQTTPKDLLVSSLIQQAFNKNKATQALEPTENPYASAIFNPNTLGQYM